MPDKKNVLQSAMNVHNLWRGNYNMLNKLKSIANTAVRKTEEFKLGEKAAGLRAFAKKVSAFIYKVVDISAKKISKAGVSANVVTVTGFIIGILAINFLSLEKYGYALVCILINRFFDALDGAIARHNRPTDFGVFLDATLDYIFYAGVIFGFALARPGENAIPAAFLLFAFASAACAMLAYSVIAYKNDSSKKTDITPSPFYLGGFAQGFETLIALVILCIIPGFFLQIAIILGILSMVKVLSVIAAAYYNFTIARRTPKE